MWYIFVLFIVVLAKYFVQLPQMNPFLAERSVLVLNNCRIHHNDTIAKFVWTAGKNWLANLLLFVTDHLSRLSHPLSSCLFSRFESYQVVL
jgi:hypothetical protein